MLSVCRKLLAGHNIGLRQLWEIVDNFSDGHTRSQPIKDIVDCNSHPPNTRLAATLIRLDGNDVAIAHNANQTYFLFTLKSRVD